MSSTIALPGDDHLHLADVRRRVKAIFIGSVGNLPALRGDRVHLRWDGRADRTLVPVDRNQRWFYYYLTAVIATSLFVYVTMRDTKKHSAMGRHE